MNGGLCSWNERTFFALWRVFSQRSERDAHKQQIQRDLSGDLPIIGPEEGGRFANFDAEDAALLSGRTFDNLTDASFQSFSPVSYASDKRMGLPNCFQNYNHGNACASDRFATTDANGNAVWPVTLQAFTTTPRSSMPKDRPALSGWP